jgi:hypothetical protein
VSFLLSHRGSSLVVLGCCIIFSMIVAIIGAMVDGITWNILDHTRGCYELYSNSYYGNPNYLADTVECTSGDTPIEGHCVCVQAGNSFCYHYNIANNNKYNCGNILTTYRDLLGNSTILCTVLVIGCFIYVFVLCCGGFAMLSSNYGNRNNPTDPSLQQQQGRLTQPFANTDAYPVEATAVHILPGQVVEPSMNPYYQPSKGNYV